MSDHPSLALRLNKRGADKLTNRSDLITLQPDFLKKVISKDKLFKSVEEETNLCYIIELRSSLTRVNSTNVLNEGLRIGEIGRRMNSKVKLVEIGVCRK
jgi:hypothetical protein